MTWSDPPPSKRCIAWSGRHRFEARYDEHEQKADGVDTINMADEPAAMVLKAIAANPSGRTYVKDICRHCGREIAR